MNFSEKYEHLGLNFNDQNYLCCSKIREHILEEDVIVDVCYP